MSTAREILREAADALERSAREQYGPPVTDNATEHFPEGTKRVAGRACVDLAGGDRDRGIELWRQITHDLGYMPHAVAVALIRAAGAESIIVPAAAPDY